VHTLIPAYDYCIMITALNIT